MCCLSLGSRRRAVFVSFGTVGVLPLYCGKLDVPSCKARNMLTLNTVYLGDRNRAKENECLISRLPSVVPLNGTALNSAVLGKWTFSLALSHLHLHRQEKQEQQQSNFPNATPAHSLLLYSLIQSATPAAKPDTTEKERAVLSFPFSSLRSVESADLPL